MQSMAQSKYADQIHEFRQWLWVFEVRTMGERGRSAPAWWSWVFVQYNWMTGEWSKSLLLLFTAYSGVSGYIIPREISIFAKKFFTRRIKTTTYGVQRAELASSWLQPSQWHWFYFDSLFSKRHKLRCFTRSWKRTAYLKRETEWNLIKAIRGDAQYIYIHTT